MSMMYPNGSPIPGANQFQVGGQPNYGAPLVNFGQQFAQGMNAVRPQPQGPQQPGAITPPSGPNMGGKAPGQNNMARPGDFAAKLRAFFTPGGGAQPPQTQGSGQSPAGFGPGDMAGQNPAPGTPAGGGMSFGGGASDPMMPPMNFSGGAGF
jgi:hypothetical protein